VTCQVRFDSTSMDDHCLRSNTWINTFARRFFPWALRDCSCYKVKEPLAWIFLFAASFGLTVSRHLRNLHVPEEAPFLDYSITLNCLRIPETAFWNSFSCPEQISLMVPWGVVSEALQMFGVGIVGEFWMMFFLRVFLLITVLYLLFLAISGSRLSSLICAVIPLGVPYVIEALYYGHQWANLVLVSGSIWVFIETFASRRVMKLAMIFVLLLTLSVFQNLAHLISAWLVIPVAFAISRFRSDRAQSIDRLKCYLSIATLIYAVPLTIYVIRMPFWTPLNLGNLRIFPNGGIVQLIQGFGSWWQDATFDTLSGNELPYRNLDPFTSSLRQFIRVIIFLFVVTTSLFERSSPLGNQHTKGKIATTSILLVALFVSLALSGMGGSRYFPTVWSNLPEYLKIFREPWQKFIPLYLVFFCALASQAFSAVLMKLRLRVIRHLIAILLTVTCFYLVQPSLSAFQPSRPDQILIYSDSPRYWEQLDTDLERVQQLLEHNPACIQVTNSLIPSNALVELRLWKYLSDIPRLRTLSINDALREIDVHYENCVNLYEDEWILSIRMDSPKTKYFGTSSDIILKEKCTLFESETLHLYKVCSS